MDKNWKNEILPSCLAGGICGIICLLGLLFIAPSKWYLFIPFTLIMAGVSFYAAVSDKKKTAERYQRDEKLIKTEWFFSAEGSIRTDSDTKAKFFFGENEVSILKYKKVRPVVEVIQKDKITGNYFDRCGWLSLIVSEEKMRIVIPKEKAEEAFKVLSENNWF